MACSTPGRQEDEIVLAHEMVLACDLHQPLALEHVVDLLLNLCLCLATCAIG